MIGPENSRHSLSQWDAKLKPITTWSPTFWVVWLFLLWVLRIWRCKIKSSPEFVTQVFPRVGKCDVTRCSDKRLVGCHGGKDIVRKNYFRSAVYAWLARGFCVNPVHPNISIYILHTVLYTFPKVLTKRICLTIKSFFSCWSFPRVFWFWGEVRCLSLTGHRVGAVDVGKVGVGAEVLLRITFAKAKTIFKLDFFSPAWGDVFEFSPSFR